MTPAPYAGGGEMPGVSRDGRRVAGVPQRRGSAVVRPAATGRTRGATIPVRLLPAELVHPPGGGAPRRGRGRGAIRGRSGYRGRKGCRLASRLRPVPHPTASRGTPALADDGD